jgi:hypothetical protein
MTTIRKRLKKLRSKEVVVVVVVVVGGGGGGGGGDQGPEPRLRFALQPLGLLYILFSRSSHCRRQMCPRPTRRERSKQREVEL